MSAKISALGALTGANVQQTADLLPIVDTSVTQTKSILISELSLAQNVNGTEASLTGSQPEFDIYISHQWATRISIRFAGASTTGTGGIVIQDPNVAFSSYGSLVNAAGTVTKYSSAPITPTIFIVGPTLAASVWEASVELTRENQDSLTWMVRSFASTSNAATDCYRGAGRVVWNASPSVLKIYAGNDAFDAGAVNVLYS